MGFLTFFASFLLFSLCLYLPFPLPTSFSPTPPASPPPYTPLSPPLSLQSFSSPSLLLCLSLFFSNYLDVLQRWQTFLPLDNIWSFSCINVPLQLLSAVPSILRLFKVVSLSDTDIPNVFRYLLICPLSH